MTEERDEDLDALIKAEIDDLRTAANNLAAKSRALVALLDDAEVNHGGLLLPYVLKAKNELRLELAKWGSK